MINEGKHSLNRSFRQVWVDECSWIVPVNDDNIFDVPAKVGGSESWDIPGGHTSFQVKRIQRDRMHLMLRMDILRGGSKLALTYMLSFDNKDLRRDLTCEMFRYENSGMTNIVQKPIAAPTVYCGKWNRLFMATPLGSTSNKGTESITLICDMQTCY